MKMNKLASGIVAAGFLGMAAAAWAASTQIQFQDALFNMGFSQLDLQATLDKGSKSYVAGAAGAGSQPYIEAINTATAKTLWSVTDIDHTGAFRELVLIGGALCAAGEVDDNNGDGGDNVLIACYNAANGKLLWQKELENPTDAMSHLGLEHLSGGKGLLVWVNDPDANNRLVLGYNVKTGLSIKAP